MRSKVCAAIAAAGALALVAASPVLAGADQPPARVVDLGSLLAASLAWLVPAGLVLIAAAGVPPERAWHSALGGVAGIGLAVLAFFLVGFGLAFGGLGLAQPQEAGFDGLLLEWSALGPAWGPNWGMAGLSGWALQGDAATEAVYGLFFAQLPWVVTATLIPLVALRGRSPAPISLVIGLAMGGLLYPLATNWVWGGGWLANLGINLNLGHGFVDFAAAGTAHLVGGAVALAGLLVLVPRRPRRDAAEDEAVAPPAVHLPLLASVGALLVLAGSLGWAWANPLLDTATLMPMRGVVNAVLAAGGGALLPLAYIWFATGRPDALMAARGLAAGAVAGAAVGPFVPPSWALGMGAFVGLAVPILVYLVTELLRLEDDTGIVPVHLAGALLGLLAVGLLADGLAGAGWNQVGTWSYLGVLGQGVTGLLAADGMQPDWPAQMQAQAVGLGALFLVPFLLTTVVLAPVAAVARGLAGRTQAGQAVPETAKGEVSPAALPQESAEGA